MTLLITFKVKSILRNNVKYGKVSLAITLEETKGVCWSRCLHMSTYKLSFVREMIILQDRKLSFWKFLNMSYRNRLLYKKHLSHQSNVKVFICARLLTIPKKKNGTQYFGWNWFFINAYIFHHRIRHISIGNDDRICCITSNLIWTTNVSCL